MAAACEPGKTTEPEPACWKAAVRTAAREGPRNVAEPSIPLRAIPSAKFEPAALPSLYVPLAKEEKDKDHPPKQITVMLRSMGDRDRDKLPHKDTLRNTDLVPWE